MKIEMGKQYQTRDGREVRIYAVDGGGFFSVHGAIKDAEEWNACTWGSDGRMRKKFDSGEDLIPVPVKHKQTVWINCYSAGIACGLSPHTTRMAADLAAGDRRIACITREIEFEEGEGL